MTSQLRVALAGNPNAGKTTIFNALTGAHQHVGNWPGKTVERKSGTFKHAGYIVEIVDLPGTYSLSAYSPEEIIARNFLLQAQPDLVIIVVDASNLERNLYLAVQLLELNMPAILVLNMMDMAQSRGFSFDIDKLSKTLGVPIITAVARKEQGLTELKDELIRVATAGRPYAYA